MKDPTTRTAHLHARLTPDEYDAIHAAADRRNVTVSELVRTLAVEAARFPFDLPALGDRAPVRPEPR